MGSSVDNRRMSDDVFVDSNSSSPLHGHSSAPSRNIEDETVNINKSHVPNNNNEWMQVCTKRRRFDIRKHYDIVWEVASGKLRGICKYCHNSYDADPMNETSVFIRHNEYKLNFVKYALMGAHGAEKGQKMVTDVHSQLDELFKEYQQVVGVSLSTGLERSIDESLLNHQFDKLEEFELYDPCEHSKSELDIYLDESHLRLSQGFCVLSYWKENAFYFPILSSLARDILATPITSVASESAFSM